MPAHVTHLLFAEDSFRTALGPDGARLLSLFGPPVVLGAQGPDIFYHNQRTMPSGLTFGKQLHRRGYGKAVSAMVESARARHGKDALFSPSGAYTLAFATHAVLDRVTHPFIIYFSGWVDAQRPETQRLYLCHAFFERILDVIMLKLLRGRDIGSMNFVQLVDCGPELPEEFSTGLLSALVAALPGVKPTLTNLKRIENAYLDTLGFYYFTNPPDRALRETARRIDLETGTGKRRLALFHPYVLPSGIDFLNEAHREWTNPSFREYTSSESFPDLYHRAAASMVDVLRSVASALRGEISPEEAEQAVGNENLNDGRSLGRPAPSRYSDPLPLPELLDSLYRV